jgi:hypothetical protein
MALKLSQGRASGPRMKDKCRSAGTGLTPGARLRAVRWQSKRSSCESPHSLGSTHNLCASPTPFNCNHANVQPCSYSCRTFQGQVQPSLGLGRNLANKPVRRYKLGCPASVAEADAPSGLRRDEAINSTKGGEPGNLLPPQANTIETRRMAAYRPTYYKLTRILEPDQAFCFKNV